MELRSSGIGVDVPQGWDGEIYRRGSDFQPLSHGEVARPVMHLANFSLPLDRGDYGSGAVELMRSENVMVMLLEHGPESLGTALFKRQGIPSVSADDFAPHTMQRTIGGMSGAQYFFTHQGRPFCLYVVLGAHARRQELVPEVNAVLANLELDAR